MIWAYWIATYVVELRQGELDAYLQNVPLVDRTSEVREALVIAITKQAALKAVEVGRSDRRSAQEHHRSEKRGAREARNYDCSLRAWSVG